MKSYSNYFATLHDESKKFRSRFGSNGYSIVRAPIWVGFDLKPLSKPRFHTFAVAWDEDHDERVIQVAEKLYFAGVLQCVSMIYERKGIVLMKIIEEIDETTDAGVFSEINKRLHDNCSPVCGDSWDLDLDSSHPEVEKYTGQNISEECRDAIFSNFTLGHSPVILEYSRMEHWTV